MIITLRARGLLRVNVRWGARIAVYVHFSRANGRELRLYAQLHTQQRLSVLDGGEGGGVR